MGGYFARVYPQAEPVIAAKIRHVPNGMFINVEQPSRSIRTHTAENGEVYGIVAGPAFKPGQPDAEREGFAQIEQWLTDNFGAGAIEYRWVNEDYTSMDDAPFIGCSPKMGGPYLVATGFAAWGITNGTAAGMILADLVSGKPNKWLEVFDATRLKPLAGAQKALKENLGVAAHLVGGFFSRQPTSIDELALGEAAVLKIDGKDVAAFKDEQGTVYKVSAVCSHMGCKLGWNETDRTWDCPCHVSRFDLGGEVLHGPAVKPIAIS